MAAYASQVLLLGVLVAASADAAADEPPARAAPPSWTEASSQPFFEDARDHLIGERPPTGVGSPPATAQEAVLEAADEFAWSELIDADALATEVKRIAARLAAPLASPSAFKAGGYRACRLACGELAVLMAVIDQYDGDVRWQRDAAALRDEASRVAVACREGTDAALADAVRLRDNLSDLIRGQRLGDAAARPLISWSELVNRPLLMHRMERSMEEGVEPRLSDSATLAKAAVDVQQEAMVLAVLAEVIRRAEFQYWDDDTYVGYAKELGTHAQTLRHAASEGDYEAARRAAGAVRNACSKCHDGYQG